MAELADALDLGSSAFGRGGSNPFSRMTPYGVFFYAHFSGWGFHSFQAESEQAGTKGGIVAA